MIALGSCTRVVGCWWEIVSGNCRHAVGKPQKQELGMHAELMCAYIVRRVKRAPTEWTYIAVLVVLWHAVARCGHCGAVRDLDVSLVQGTVRTFVNARQIRNKSRFSCYLCCGMVLTAPMVCVMLQPTSVTPRRSNCGDRAMRGVKKNDQLLQEKRQQAKRNVEEKLQELVATKAKATKGRPKAHHYLAEVWVQLRYVCHWHKPVALSAGRAAAGSYVGVLIVHAFRC